MQVGVRVRMGALAFVIRRCAVLVLGIGAAVLLTPGMGQACSVCGGPAIGTDPGAGLNTSLLFLLAMPYIVAGAIAGWLIYTSRRASGHRQEGEVGHTVVSIVKESK